MSEISSKCGIEGIVPVSIAGALLPSSAEAASRKDVISAIESAATLAAEAIARGYRTAPALMLGLAVLCAIPLLAVSARIHAILARSADATRRFTGVRGETAKRISGDDSEVTGKAFLEVVGAADMRFAIPRDMLRIGREDDNDIRIPSNAVHRYHAAIHREDFGDYRITDLSGRDGNGIMINGKRCDDARLEDGDLIELGPGQLRFHAGLV